MKKVIAITAAVVLVLAIGVPAAFAMGHGFGHAAGTGAPRAAYAASGVGQKLADAQNVLESKAEAAGDIAQDDAGTAVCSRFADEDGDGVCDNCGRGCGSCPNYVDADNDGVCDNQGTRHMSAGTCRGGQQGCSNGWHNGYHHAGK